MAVTVRSSAKANVTVAGTAMSVNKPAGCVAGDVVYLFLALGTSIGVSTTPTGFTVLSGPDVNPSDTVSTYVYRRVCDGSEGATFTSTVTLARWSAIAVCVQGADNSAPEAATTTKTLFAGATTLSHVAPTISPATAGSLLLCAFSTERNGGESRSYTAPGSMAELQDIAVTDDVALMVASESIAASGATGTRTATLAVTAARYNTYSVSVQAVAATNVTPSRVDAIGGVGTATITASSTPTQTRVDATASVPVPALSASLRTVRVDAVASIPTPTIAISVTATPTRVDAVATVPAPLVTPLSATILPSAVAAVATVGTVSILITNTEEPASVAVVAIIPTPTIIATADVTPARVDAVVTVNGTTPVETESIVVMTGPLVNTRHLHEQINFDRTRLARMVGPTPTGQSIYKINGHWRVKETPSMQLLETAEDFIIGGHERTMTYTEFLLIESDGIDCTLIEVLA